MAAGGVCTEGTSTSSTHQTILPPMLMNLNPFQAVNQDGAARRFERALARHRSGTARLRRRLDGRRSRTDLRTWLDTVHGAWRAWRSVEGGRRDGATRSAGHRLATAFSCGVGVLLIAFALLFAVGYLHQTPELTRSQIAAGRMGMVLDPAGRLLGGTRPKDTPAGALQEQGYFFGPSPPVLRAAVLRLEDRGHGQGGWLRPCDLPWAQVIWRWLRSGGTAGGSTITMQLARQLNGYGDESGLWAKLLRKPQEMGAACRLHAQLPAELGRDAAVDLYTSIAPMMQGSGTLRGATAAAYAMWGLAPTDLTAAQQILLAASVKRPIVLPRPGDLDVACDAVWPVAGNPRRDVSAAAARPARVNQCRTLHRALAVAPQLLRGPALETALVELRRYQADGLHADNPFDLESPQVLINIERRGRQFMAPLQGELQREAAQYADSRAPLRTSVDGVVQQRFVQDQQLLLRQIQRSRDGERAICLPLTGPRAGPPRQACGMQIDGELAAQRLGLKVDLRSGAMQVFDIAGAVQLDTPLAMASLAKLPILVAAIAAGESADSTWCPRRALAAGGRPLRRVGRPEIGYTDAECRDPARRPTLERSTADSDNLALLELARHLGQPALQRALEALGLDAADDGTAPQLPYELAFGTWTASPRQVLAAWQALVAVAYGLEVDGEAPRVVQGAQAGTASRVRTLRQLLAHEGQRAELRRLLEAPVRLPGGTLSGLSGEIVAGKSGTAVSRAVDPDRQPLLHSMAAVAYRPHDGSITFWWIGSPRPDVPLALRHTPAALLQPLHRGLLRAGP